MQPDKLSKDQRPKVLQKALQVSKLYDENKVVLNDYEQRTLYSIIAQATHEKSISVNQAGFINDLLKRARKRKGLDLGDRFVNKPVSLR